MNNKVLLGMSGGVDSSVAALLLKRQGYSVTGVNFSFTDNIDRSDVTAVAEKLGVPLVFVDFKDIFKQKVLSPFIAAYSHGKTPNICVACNKFIKFGAMFDLADKYGCQYVSTGHYCSITNVSGHFYLSQAKDGAKDQTYFLHQITEEKLARVLFPLAELEKSEVRNIAERENLVTAHKKGSSDICVMGDMSFPEFIGQYIPAATGDIVDDKGVVVGKHKGIFNYTLGQRKGLDLGGRSGEDGRWFVIGKDVAKNRLIVSHGDENALLTRSVTVKNVNFINGAPEDQTFDCFAKTRYRQSATAATVRLFDGNKAEVIFREPVRAATSGQYCVFYDGQYCLGGGEIE